MTIINIINQKQQIPLAVTRTRSSIHLNSQYETSSISHHNSQYIITLSISVHHNSQVRKDRQERNHVGRLLAEEGELAQHRRRMEAKDQREIREK
jgi:hypothetical protein